MSEKTVISYQIPPLKQPTFPHPEHMIISDLTQLFDNKQGGISPTNPTNIWQVNDAGVYPENFCGSSSA